jgi:E3 ubiquitin-protein ligase SHPRH
LVVKGSWGTKVEAVVRRVLWLLDETRPGADPAVKALVFSEWEDALRVVAAALRANGVPAEHPLGGGRKLRDAIERFKGGARGAGAAAAATAGGGGGGGGSGASTSIANATVAAGAGGSAVTVGAGGQHRQHQHALHPPPPPPPPRVLLMPLRRGANGLNLTEAQHVILLEPVLDPGAEAQAMKRVDRIGQTKPTCVHRFLLAGTVGPLYSC